MDVPTDAPRIDLPVKYSRVLSRIALGNDQAKAEGFQHQFKLRATGSPKLPVIPETPVFELEKPPGVEAFEAAPVALTGEPDLSVGLEPLSKNALDIAIDTKERQRVDAIIKKHAFTEIRKAGQTIGHGVVYNGWARPGVVGEYGLDYLARTLVNNGGIWANVKPEVLYYRARG